MLTNVEKGQRVLLENGLKGTVTQVNASWSGTRSMTIRADGGLYKTRTYSSDGTTNDAEFNVASVLAVGYKGTVSKLTEQIQTLQNDIAALLDFAYEMETTAITPPATKLKEYDFGDGNGLVPAHRHTNPTGDEGGIVADTAFVDATSTVGRGSVVFAKAKVVNGAKIINNSRISGNIDGKRIESLEVTSTTARALAA
jgi:hypothetical protein